MVDHPLFDCGSSRLALGAPGSNASPSWALAYWEEPTAQRLDHKCEFKYLVCNIYDATLKIIAVAKVEANIVIHICSSIA